MQQYPHHTQPSWPGLAPAPTFVVRSALLISYSHLDLLACPCYSRHNGATTPSPHLPCSLMTALQGTKEFPQCGFSNTVVQILRSLDAPFESVNILENDMLRSGMKEYSQWPT